MILIDDNLLDEFRSRLCCEWCRRPGLVQPHHIFCRGMGGGSRLDIRRNLIGLCPHCHHEVHAGHIARFDLLAIVAQREKCQQADIEEEVYKLLREKKP